MRKFIYMMCVASLFTLGFSQNSWKDILEKTSNLNKGLKTFKATAKVKSNIMGIIIPFKADFCFEKPNKVWVVFSSSEDISQLKSIFKKSLPQSLNPKDYAGKLLGIEDFQGVKCYMIQLIPLRDKKISRVYIWIHTKSYLPVKSKIFYRDGAEVTVIQSFKTWGNFILPCKQLIKYRSNMLKIDSYVEYVTYKVNIPLHSSNLHN